MDELHDMQQAIDEAEMLIRLLLIHFTGQHLVNVTDRTLQQQALIWLTTYAPITEQVM